MGTVTGHVEGLRFHAGKALHIISQLKSHLSIFRRRYNLVFRALEGHCTAQGIAAAGVVVAGIAQVKIAGHFAVIHGEVVAVNRICPFVRYGDRTIRRSQRSPP